MKPFTTAWQHIRRSPYQALAAILTMFVTLLLAGFFTLASVSSVVILSYFESKPQITVFFSDKAGNAEAEALQKMLKDSGKVSGMKYVSKDDALAIYKEQNKADPLLLEMVTADILPASLEVSAIDPAFLQELEPVIKNSPGIEEVVYQRDVVESLLMWTRGIRVVGAALAGLLAVDSILIIMTVISMKIALKKEEIEILRLVGASPWYIRSPFVLEGGWYGVLGAGMSWLVLSGLLLWLRPVILEFIGIIPAVSLLLGDPTSTLFLVSAGGFLGVLVVTGFLLGSFGSWVATLRFLKL